MKKPLHRNVLSCAASPLKLSELKSSKQICYQVAASHLNPCALLLAEMITINKLRQKLDISHHESMRPPPSLLMHQTSSGSDKNSSPGEHLKKNKCALLSRCALLHANAPEQERMAMAPWMNSPCKLQAPRVSLKPSRVLAQTPMKCAPSPPQDVRPPSLPHKSQVKNESPKCLYPLFSLLMPTLKDQWPRLDLAKSNQWVRSTPIISLRKPTFLSCFMSINSPTL
jgi:hypothetical protein